MSAMQSASKAASVARAAVAGRVSSAAPAQAMPAADPQHVEEERAVAVTVRMTAKGTKKAEAD